MTGVEASTAAVRDARRNLRQTPWAAVYQGDAGEVIARGVLPPARLAVLDPPRAGAARDVIEYLATGPGPAGPGADPSSAADRSANSARASGPSTRPAPSSNPNGTGWGAGQSHPSSSEPNVTARAGSSPAIR